jgi:hypothetical protein
MDSLPLVMNSETRVSIRHKELGWILMTIGGGCIALLWAFLIPLVKRQDPSLDPRLSLATFWEEKQQALDQDLLVYHDAWYIGLFGDKVWAEKAVQWVIEGKRPLLDHGASPAYSLPKLTNHEFPRDADAAVVWANWWKGHESLSQEQWLQEGFKNHGFEISLPPSQNDWPKLLSILGATAGPTEFPLDTVEILYPEHLRYNAYRWLRDSGFEPMRYLTDHADRSMPGDESGGVIEFQRGAGGLNQFICPLPGRMAFADQEWYGGQTLDGGIHLELFSHRVVQAGMTVAFTVPFILGLYLVGRQESGTSSRVSISQNEKSKPRLWRSLRLVLGWLLIIAGAGCAMGHWFLVVPWLQGKEPDYTPHLSVQGYWDSKQTHLKWGRWWHEDGWVVGLFGDKAWAERLMQWMAAGKEMENCGNGHWEEALPFITNHKLAFSNSGQAWQDWWKSNKHKTQEEWIQDGFKNHGFEIGLPPAKEDWPHLLTLMGSSAGPEPALEDGSGQPQQHTYPFHARYNAYRWLRDSGFEPAFYVLSHRHEISGEALSGAQNYWEMEQDDVLKLFAVPLPGRFAFAPSPDWGFSRRFIFNGPPFELSGRFELAFIAGCSVVCLIGWLLVRRRKKVLRADV